MKNHTLLTVTSLLSIVLTSLHLADDVVRGFDPGGLNNLNGIAILAVWLVAVLLLVPRRANSEGRLRPFVGYVVLLLGSLLAAVIPALHCSGRGVGGAFAATPGSYFFIWTLFALGVSGTLSLILTLSGFWSLRQH